MATIEQPDHTGRFTVRARGLDDEDEDRQRSDLLKQLSKIPKDAEKVMIDDSTPSDLEWRLLGDHLTSVKDLELDAGFEEDLNDKGIPQHWPLERLVFASSCGQVFQSPFVLEGKVEHLALYLTCGLRFEGPTTEELCREYSEAIKSGEKEAEYVGKIQFTYIPALVSEWMQKEYGNKTVFGHPNPPPPQQIKLRKLEILENDAMDAMNRFMVALPHLADQIQTLNIRSTHNLDFHYSSEEMVPQVLPQFPKLETLVFSVGEVFKSKDLLPKLYEYFPRTLTTLRFRGPASLVKSEHWKEWIDAFANPEYLPHVTKLSFVLDLWYEKGENDYRATEKEVPEDVLKEAREACEGLYKVARGRGITIEPFYDEWAERCRIFRQVDDRWTM